MNIRRVDLGSLLKLNKIMLGTGVGRIDVDDADVGL
jgi:hypothetical protein